MNKTIRQIFVVVLGLFVLLLANLTYIQGFQQDKYAVSYTHLTLPTNREV